MAKRRLCKTCRHWNTDDHQSDFDVACTFLHGKTRGDCLKSGVVGEEPIDPTTLALCRDDTGYSSYLITLPNFGCVMHEPA